MEEVGNSLYGYCSCCHWGNNLLCVAKADVGSGVASGTSSNGNIIVSSAGFGRSGGSDSANGVSKTNGSISCRRGD
jgi:hypothetical protein